MIGHNNHPLRKRPPARKNITRSSSTRLPHNTNARSSPATKCRRERGSNLLHLQRDDQMPSRDTRTPLRIGARRKVRIPRDRGHGSPLLNFSNSYSSTTILVLPSRPAIDGHHGDSNSNTKRDGLRLCGTKSSVALSLLRACLVRSGGVGVSVRLLPNLSTFERAWMSGVDPSMWITL